MIGLAGLLLALQAADVERVLDEYWHFLEPLGVYDEQGLARHLPDALSEEEDRRFREVYPKLLERMGKAVSEAGIAPAELRRGLIEGDARALRELAPKTRSPELKAVLLASIDLDAALAQVGKTGEPFRTVCAYLCKALLGLFHLGISQRQLVRLRLEAAVQEVLGRRPEREDWVRGYLRMAADRVFLTHFQRGSRGPEGALQEGLREAAGKDPDLALYAVLKGWSEPDAESPPPVWAAYLRWTLGEHRQNFGLTDRAIQAHPTNAYFYYLKAYGEWFAGRGEAGREALQKGNESKEYRSGTLEILQALARAHSGPLRYYLAIYELKTPHVDWFFHISNTYVSQRVGGLLKAGDLAGSRKLLDETRRFLVRAYRDARLYEEHERILSALRNSFFSEAEVYRELGRTETYLKLERELSAVELRLAALRTALNVPSELEFMIAGLLLDGRKVGELWAVRRKEGLDAGKLAAAEKRYRTEIVEGFLKRRPEFGGDPEDPDYLDAKKKFEAGKFLEAVRACDRVLIRRSMHIHAIELKRKALERIR